MTVPLSKTSQALIAGIRRDYKVAGWLGVFGTAAMYGFSLVMMKGLFALVGMFSKPVRDPSSTEIIAVAYLLGVAVHRRYIVSWTRRAEGALHAWWDTVANASHPNPFRTTAQSQPSPLSTWKMSPFMWGLATLGQLGSTAGCIALNLIPNDVIKASDPDASYWWPVPLSIAIVFAFVYAALVNKRLNHAQKLIHALEIERAQDGILPDSLSPPNWPGLPKIESSSS